MTHFYINPERVCPYKDFSFQVRWDGRYVAGFSSMSALKPSIEAFHDRQEHGPAGFRKRSERSSKKAICLKRGVSHDPDFITWTMQGQNSDHPPARGTHRLHQDVDIIVEIVNELGGVELAYRFNTCRVTKLLALPVPDLTNAVAIEHISLKCEGWEQHEVSSEFYKFQ